MTAEQQRLTAQRKQLKMMVMVTKCPNCGHDNRDEANYCLKCGVKLTVPPIQNASETVTTQQAMTREPEVPSACSFHPLTVASYLCGRCGRALCRSCVRFSSGMIFCPICWTGPVQPYPFLQGHVTRLHYPLTMSRRWLG